MGLEDEIAALTRRFSTLDHTWDEERAALEASRAKVGSWIDGLALELVQVRSYIHGVWVRGQ